MFNKKVKKTADGIMASFSTAIADLDDVATNSDVDIQEANDAIAEAEAKLEAARTERKKALTFATNLKALME